MMGKRVTKGSRVKFTADGWARFRGESPNEFASEEILTVVQIVKKADGGRLYRVASPETGVMADVKGGWLEVVADDPPPPATPGRRRDPVVEDIQEVYKRYFKNWHLNDKGLDTVETWLLEYSYDEITRAIKVAAETYLRYDENGKAKSEYVEGAFDKVAGILVTTRRELSQPYLKDLYTIRKIAEQTMYRFDKNEATALLERAFEAGCTAASLRAMTKAIRDWYAWCAAVTKRIVEAEAAREAETLPKVKVSPCRGCEGAGWFRGLDDHGQPKYTLCDLCGGKGIDHPCDCDYQWLEFYGFVWRSKEKLPGAKTARWVVAARPHADPPPSCCPRCGGSLFLRDDREAGPPQPEPEPVPPSTGGPAN